MVEEEKEGEEKFPRNGEEGCGGIKLIFKKKNLIFWGLIK